jgi:hypothetical protein
VLSEKLFIIPVGELLIIIDSSTKNSHPHIRDGSLNSRGTTLLADPQISLLISPTVASTMLTTIGCPDNGGLTGMSYLIADGMWLIALVANHFFMDATKTNS